MSTPELRHREFDGIRLAYRLREGVSPALMFLPGYASDMEGTKALALDAFGEARGLSMLRFDYSGTGSSDGEFEQGTLQRWLDEALHMLDHVVEGPVVVIGSSMGGWIALHAALLRPERIAALVGIAAAPDFTDWGYSDTDKQELQREGRLEQANPYSPEPHVTTNGFWQSGQDLLLLERPIEIGCPIRLLHGENDQEVPLPVAYRLLQQLRSADVQLNILKGGGHRLSEPHEIRAIVHSVAGLLETSQ